MEGTGNGFSGYRMWLAQELSRRQERNPAYSLTAFSKSLGISPTAVSQIISGKRPLSAKNAWRIISRCGLPSEEALAFLAASERNQLSQSFTKGDRASEAVELELETFRQISDWRHYAILCLGAVKGNKSNPKWIAKELGISVQAASIAFKRLLKLGLISKNGSGFRDTANSSNVPTKADLKPAIRKYHLESLRKAEETLESGKGALEHFSTLTMAIDEKNLERARKMVNRFRKQICKILEAGDQERVYTLSIQLFPLSREKGKKNVLH